MDLSDVTLGGWVHRRTIPIRCGPHSGGLAHFRATVLPTWAGGSCDFIPFFSRKVLKVHIERCAQTVHYLVNAKLVRERCFERGILSRPRRKKGKNIKKLIFTGFTADMVEEKGAPPGKNGKTNKLFDFYRFYRGYGREKGAPPR